MIGYCPPSCLYHLFEFSSKGREGSRSQKWVLHKTLNFQDVCFIQRTPSSSGGYIFAPSLILNLHTLIHLRQENCHQNTMPSKRLVLICKNPISKLADSCSRSLDHRSEAGQFRRTSTTKPTSQVQNSNHEKNNRQASTKFKNARPNTNSSKTTKNSDIDDLSSAFANLSSKDPASEKPVISEKEQIRSKWNIETRAATLNARKIVVPPKDPMFYGKNINANIYQKQTIRRLHNDRWEVRVELANPPDPKTLINPADLIPKLDPDIQARQDAFNAKYGPDNKDFDERQKRAHALRAQKSQESLAKRDKAFKKNGRNVWGLRDDEVDR